MRQGTRESDRTIVWINISNNPDQQILFKGVIYGWAELTFFDIRKLEIIPITYSELGGVGRRGDIVVPTISEADLQQWQSDHNYEPVILQLEIARY